MNNFKYALQHMMNRINTFNKTYSKGLTPSLQQDIYHFLTLSRYYLESLDNKDKTTKPTASSTIMPIFHEEIKQALYTLSHRIQVQVMALKDVTAEFTPEDLLNPSKDEDKKKPELMDKNSINLLLTQAQTQISDEKEKKKVETTSDTTEPNPDDSSDPDPDPDPNPEPEKIELILSEDELFDPKVIKNLPPSLIEKLADYQIQRLDAVSNHLDRLSQSITKTQTKKVTKTDTDTPLQNSHSQSQSQTLKTSEKKKDSDPSDNTNTNTNSTTQHEKEKRPTKNKKLDDLTYI